VATRLVLDELDLDLAALAAALVVVIVIVVGIALALALDAAGRVGGKSSVAVADSLVVVGGRDVRVVVGDLGCHCEGSGGWTTVVVGDVTN
jgi:hypothetical protein